MRAIVLAGGKGSRLRPLTISIPKPLVPIGDMSIIEILIRQLAGLGFERVTVSVGHLAGLMRAFCGDGRQWGVDIDYVQEDEPLGTAGCLALVEDLEEGPVLVVNGDTLTDLDFAQAVSVHDYESGVTICANTRAVNIDFGVLEIDDDNLLVGYNEKPTLEYSVSMGVNVVSDWVIKERIEKGRKLDMPDLILRLQSDGVPVKVHDPGAYWLDLGRMSDLETGEQVFTAERDRFLPT